MATSITHSWTVSDTFKIALALHKEPAYRLAVQAGMHPTILSKMLHGAMYIAPNDPRIIAVGRELGLSPAQCFAEAKPGVSQNLSHPRRYRRIS